MIKTIEHEGNVYPAFQAEGFAAQFAIPFAQKVCIGVGYDIGCNRPEWSLPGSIPIDPLIGDYGYEAMNLPFGNVDYIFSSHCIEHLPNWVDALDYWKNMLADGGVLFLYLPNMDLQSYWRPWYNRKHIHYLTPEILTAYFTQPGWKNVFISGTDLNCSFTVIAEKCQ